MANFPSSLTTTTAAPYLTRIIPNDLGAFTGQIVGSAGDVNGDGRTDLLISALLADFGGDNTGSVYVIFGGAALGATFDLASLDGTNGFRVDGNLVGQSMGQSVTTLGDINGDGFDDLLIGNTYAGGGDGEAYVVFGAAGGFGASLSVGALDGTNGFRVESPFFNSNFGISSTNIGDLNDDGLDDFAIGAPAEDFGGSTSGSVYVVFGRSGAYSASMDLTTLDGSNGFRVDGLAANDALGRRVSAAGDVNGDGIADLAMFATTAGHSGLIMTGIGYILYGHSGAFAATMTPADLTGAAGTTIRGDVQVGFFGIGADDIGDFNGDGYGDLLVGSQVSGGRAYVLFGGPALVSNVSQLTGANGFAIQGIGSIEIGSALAAAGDINNDGFDDIILGGRSATAGGLSNAGTAWVLLGRASGFAASVSLATLAQPDGFKISGAASNARLGFNVGAVGDFNGDGIDDLLISRYGANGDTYLLYGQQGNLTRAGTSGKDTLLGASADDTLSGLDSNDVLQGLGGADIIDGGDGGDIVDGGDGDDLLTGGAGSDKLLGGDGTDDLGGGDGRDRLDGGAGADDLIGGADNDYLDGGAGADQLVGGTGNDVYIADALDTLTEDANAGYDIVRTDVDGFALGANFEALELTGAADIDGSGNSEANNLQGNSGANTLDGGAGVDTVNGNDGDDIILGGLGNDLLRGGLGADTFRVAHAFGGVLETDQIYDFSAAEGDILDLSAAYAGTLSRVASFGRHAGEMTLTFAGGLTTLRLDINGDGRVDYQMKINGDVTAESGDWVL